MQSYKHEGNKNAVEKDERMKQRYNQKWFIYN